MFRLLTGNLRGRCRLTDTHAYRERPVNRAVLSAWRTKSPTSTPAYRGARSTRATSFGASMTAVEEIADFLCRTKAEIRARMEELGLKEAENPKPFPPTSH